MTQTCRPACLICRVGDRNSLSRVALPAIDDIIRENGPAVRAFVRSQVRDAALTEDIVQETFIRVWRYLPTYRGEGSLQGWIIRIAQNVVRTTMRKHARVLAAAERESHERAVAASAPVDDYGNVDLLDLISTLSPEHRAVTTMCLVLGFTYEETAAVLEIPVGTVRSRVSRARDQLRARLDTAGSDTRAVAPAAAQ